MEVKAQNKAEENFQRQVNLFRVQKGSTTKRSTRKTRCEIEMEKDCVQWEQQRASASSTKRSPGGLTANVHEKVETWKEYLAKHSHLPGYDHARPTSRA